MATPPNLTALAEAYGPADDEEPEPQGPRLATPRVRVTMDDGRVLEAQVRNPDFLRWDRTSAKHGWPDMRKAPVTWLTFVSWSALRRDGSIPEAMSWEQFSEVHALQVESIAAAPGQAGDMEGTGDGAVPTPPGAGPG